MFYVKEKQGQGARLVLKLFDKNMQDCFGNYHMKFHYYYFKLKRLLKCYFVNKHTLISIGRRRNTNQHYLWYI